MVNFQSKKEIMKSKYLCLLLVSLVWISCNKVEVSAPDFAVTAVSKTVKAGEEVKFGFTGDPDQISFYSGEPLKDYNYKTGRVLTASGLTTSFTTTVQYGTQTNQLSVLVSTDFSGNYVMEDIRKATWLDITKDYALATSTTQKVWGPKDLQSMLVGGKPVYIAFRYKTLPQTLNGGGRTWTIRSFQFETVTELGVVTLADHIGTGFKLVHDGPFEPGRSSVGSTSITLRANAADIDTPTEDWAISKAVTVGTVDMGPDRPISLKGFVNTKATDYKYIYTKPGTYKATFVASNSNIYGAAEVVKQIEITVQP